MAYLSANLERLVNYAKEEKASNEEIQEQLLSLIEYNKLLEERILRLRSSCAELEESLNPPESNLYSFFQTIFNYFKSD